MRRIAAILCTLLLLTPLAHASDRPEALYFFENYCDSCHPENDFRTQFASLTGRDLDDYRYLYYNAVHPSGRKALDDAAAARGLALDDLKLPLLIVDGQLYAGSTAIRDALPRDFLDNQSTDSLIYYLFSPGCRDCAKMDEALAALPERIQVTRGDYTFESKVVVRKISAAEDPDAAAALFDRYEVKEDARYAPCLFMGGQITVTDPDHAARFLGGKLQRGEAVGTPVLDGE